MQKKIYLVYVDRTVCACFDDVKTANEFWVLLDLYGGSHIEERTVFYSLPTTIGYNE